MIQGMLGVFKELDATVDAIDALKQGGRTATSRCSCRRPITRLEHAVGAPESPVRTFTLIGGLFGA